MSVPRAAQSIALSSRDRAPKNSPIVQKNPKMGVYEHDLGADLIFFEPFWADEWLPLGTALGFSGSGRTGFSLANRLRVALLW